MGSAMWAGNAFATLPDTSSMEAELYLPQTQSEGVKIGLAIELSPVGAPGEKIDSTISWVAAAAAPRGRESPVKFLSFKAPVPAASLARYHWAPGQRFDAHVILLRADKAITVPNVAVRSQGGNAQVSLMADGHAVERSVQLGVRGPSRSQVLSGLTAGERIVVLGAESEIAKPAKPPPMIRILRGIGPFMEAGSCHGRTGLAIDGLTEFRPSKTGLEPGKWGHFFRPSSASMQSKSVWMSSRSLSPHSAFIFSRNGVARSFQPSFLMKLFQMVMSQSSSFRPWTKHHWRISSSLPPSSTRLTRSG